MVRSGVSRGRARASGKRASSVRIPAFKVDLSKVATFTSTPRSLESESPLTIAPVPYGSAARVQEAAAESIDRPIKVERIRGR